MLGISRGTGEIFNVHFSIFNIHFRLWCLGALLVAGACFDSSAPSTGFGIVQGTVRSATDGQVLGSVGVDVAGVQTVTNSQGTFRLDRLLAGRYLFRATLPEYESFEDSVTVFSNGNTVVSVLLSPEGFALGVPAGIAAEPGPSPNGITVLWTPIDDAVNYALYISTSTSVAPIDGIRIGGVTPPYSHRNLDPNLTYYYAVSGLGLVAEGPISAVVQTKPRDKIEIRVESPAVGAFVGNEVAISARVIGDNPLSTVRATLGTADIALAFNSDFARWEGVLSLNPTSGGVAMLVITATDAQNNVASAQRTLRR